jgi:hypothetical protein
MERRKCSELAIKPGYYALALPQLNFMTVSKLLCGLYRRTVIGAVEFDRPDNMAVAAN